MRIDGFEVKEYQERRKARGDDVIVEYFITLKSKNGDRFSVTTQNKAIKELIVNNDVTVEICAPQTQIKEVHEDGRPV